ncbi:helix-turn-helix domain-containing protein [Actinomadura kijaniata]|uniref:helix-turn-helix domain-containing protein n=1 Tax=Actinomadura kijaniata TaxID=46161 RepID=UPI003F1DAAE3
MIAFGNQVRFWRERLGLSQERLGERIPVSGSYIGQIETGRTRCTREFAGQLDDALDLHGALVRLWDDLVRNTVYPVWFDWPAIEREAVELAAFELSVVYGLLQTPEYIRALLAEDAAVEARLERQLILTRDDPPPPVLSVLLDESVLHREVGNQKIMREQLERLIDCQSRRLTINIVPMGVHDGLSGSFVLATMPDRSQVSYVDSAVRGLTMGGTDDAAKVSESLTSLRADAYSVRESTEIIRRVVEEKWT